MIWESTSSTASGAAFVGVEAAQVEHVWEAGEPGGEPLREREGQLRLAHAAKAMHAGDGDAGGALPGDAVKQHLQIFVAAKQRDGGAEVVRARDVALDVEGVVELALDY